jgi:predicted transglutaminase-like cysteine proteinase
MVLGSAAVPPAGYINFCSRRPDQCGLDAVRDEQDKPLQSAALAKLLYARYYWPAAIPGAAYSDSEAPASGGAASLTAPTSPSEGNMAAPAVSSLLHASPAGDATGAQKTIGSNLASARAAAAQAAGSVAAPGSLQDRAEQGVTLVGQTKLAVTGALMAKLNAVNERVNSSIRYVSDTAQFGQTDYWTLPLEAGASAAGDCKDYVLEKRRALVSRGVPASALSIAIVETSWGEIHAVLLVATTQGDLVLDSLSAWIQPWTQSHYRWIKRQQPGQSMNWAAIVPQT